MYTNIKDLNITISKKHETKKDDFVWSFNLVLTKKARKELLTKERMRTIKREKRKKKRDINESDFLKSMSGRFEPATPA